MAGDGEHSEHWSLMFLDGYILYNGLYLFLLITFSMARIGRGYSTMSDLRDYASHNAPGIFGAWGEFDRFREHKKWWDEENAKKTAAAALTPQVGGGNTYSIKTWTIVLLFTLFLFILAILFPSKTIDNFSSVTMPSLFKGSILDTDISDSAKLGSLFGFMGGSGEKYTVSQYDLEDIEFIRTTDTSFRESNDAAKDIPMPANLVTLFDMPTLKRVCGNKGDTTQYLHEGNGTCKVGMISSGWNCPNLSKSPCCQRYCPSEEGGWGTYHGGDKQGDAAVDIDGNIKLHGQSDWQCNTASEWDEANWVCKDIESGKTTDPVYILVSDDAYKHLLKVGEAPPEVSNGGGSLIA